MCRATITSRLNDNVSYSTKGGFGTVDHLAVLVKRDDKPRRSFGEVITVEHVGLVSDTVSFLGSATDIGSIVLLRLSGTKNQRTYL